MSPIMKALSSIGLSLVFLVVSYWVASQSDSAVVSWADAIALLTYLLSTPFTALVVWWFMLTGRRGPLPPSHGPSLAAGLGFMLSAFCLHCALGVLCNHLTRDVSFDATYGPIVVLSRGIELMMLLVVVSCTWQVAIPGTDTRKLRQATRLLVGLLVLYFTGNLLGLVAPLVVFMVRHGVSQESLMMFPILVDFAVIVVATGCWGILAMRRRRGDSGGMDSQTEQALQP